MRYQEFIQMLADRATAHGASREYVNRLAVEALHDDRALRRITDGEAFRLLYAVAYAPAQSHTINNA